MNKVRTAFLVMLMVFSIPVTGQKKTDQLKGTAFGEATIRWENGMPSDIRLPESRSMNRLDFFIEYQKAFGLDANYEFRPHGEAISMSGMTDQRYKQYYKGIEIAGTQYILHSLDGSVRHANGNPVHGLALETEPSIGVDQAILSLDKHFPEYVALHKKSKFVRHLPIHDLAEPRLMISAGTDRHTTENFRLVYRFDIFIPHSFKRYAVDIDAHTGALAGILPRSFDDNIQTRGVSLYNGIVDIVVMDEEYASLWDPSSWHLNDWNAYGGSGLSWWIADTLVGTQGGYRDAWLQALVTDPITLVGKSPSLTFHHRYAVEAPAEYEGFDAWDGVNVQISADGGQSWSVLDNPSPAYDKQNLFSFYFNGQGENIPGWCGENTEWTQVTIPLDDYSGSTVRIRFVFAADGAYSTMDEDDLFGWQIDDIRIGTVYANEGITDNISGVNITSGYVGHIDGNYRLRETTRGSGIATFNGEDVVEYGFSDAVDFVEDDTIFDALENRVGVSVHWALEESYDYFYEQHGREGYDDNGGLLRAYTGILFDGTNPNNASYIGGGQLLFGNGDGDNFGPIVSIDVAAHELAHGVTASSANLVYAYESGALNESFSDIFGKAVEFYAEGSVEDWFIGEDFVINANPFRSMSDPKLRFDPDTYLGEYWVTGEHDNGGVHTNSGVQNYWYYLLCEGGSGTNDDDFYYDVTPIDMADAEQIAYRNLTAYLVPGSEYVDAAIYSIQSATDLFGDGSQQEISVMEAWEAVGIYMDPRIFTDAILTLDLTAPDQPVTRNLLIRNKSITPLEITGLSIEGDGFYFADFPALPMEIEKSEEIGITYTPANNDPAAGTLTLATNDPDNPVVTVDLVSAGYDDLVQTTDQQGVRIGSVYPNPFRDKLYISFMMYEAGTVGIEIFNSLGEKVRTIYYPDLPPGEHMLEWKADNDQGVRVPPGNYFLILQTEEERVTKVIHLLQ